MPYALIPDGYTLKKVTNAQEKALKDKRRHDNVMELLKNPATVPIVAGAITAVIGGVIIDRFIEKAGIAKSDFVDDAKKATLQMGAPFKLTYPEWPDLDLDLGKLLEGIVPKDLKFRGLA